MKTLNGCRFWAECKIVFIESKNRFSKNGKPETSAVKLRKLFLIDPKPMFDSGDYRIVKKGDNFTISVIPHTAQSCWTNPNGSTDVWYKKAVDTVEIDQDGVEHTVRPFKRTIDKAMDEAGLLVWLACKMGQQSARIALEQLLTEEPANQRVAA